jgi:hypothetical protein
MDPNSNSNSNSNSNNYSNNDFETVDHTLLESLFYNEMMMMEESPSLLLNVLAADGTPSVDATTMAETALLGEFGVSGKSLNHTRINHTLPLQQQQQPQQQGPPQPQQQPSQPQPPPQQQQQQQQPISQQQQQQQQQQQPISQQQQPIRQQQQQQQQQPIRPPVVPAVAPPAAAAPPVPVLAASAPNLSTAASLPYISASASASATSYTAPMDDAEKRKKLVSQFATLASRLGITLPEPFVQTLASSAPPSPEQPPRQVQELQSTADAAIAVVSLKRDAASSLGTMNANNANANKRRKKPRLGDCERKLNDLKAENQVLKRHLHNISNQSHKLAEEQKAAEQQIRELWSTPTTTEGELDAAVKNFTELYSDYGKRRHDELTFHLEQLGRLANPSNVTKMGLWTLGQESSQKKKNPIAGLLQKELGITPQQGKKIVEQRQKIRAVSSNLKEVRILYTV